MMLWLLCANQQRLSVGGCFYQAFVIIMIASAAFTSKKKNPFTIHYLPNNGFMLQKNLSATQRQTFDGSRAWIINGVWWILPLSSLPSRTFCDLMKNVLRFWLNSINFLRKHFWDGELVMSPFLGVEAQHGLTLIVIRGRRPTRPLFACLGL